MESIFPEITKMFDKTVTFTVVGEIRHGIYCEIYPANRLELEIQSIRNIQFGPKNYGLVYGPGDNVRAVPKSGLGAFRVYKHANLIPLQLPDVEPFIYSVPKLAEDSTFGKALGKYLGLINHPMSLQNAAGQEIIMEAGHKVAWDRSKSKFDKAIETNFDGVKLTVAEFHSNAHKLPKELEETKLSSFLS